MEEMPMNMVGALWLSKEGASSSSSRRLVRGAPQQLLLQRWVEWSAVLLSEPHFQVSERVSWLSLVWEFEERSLIWSFGGSIRFFHKFEVHLWRLSRLLGVLGDELARCFCSSSGNMSVWCPGFCCSAWLLQRWVGWSSELLSGPHLTLRFKVSEWAG